mmetsp:Transcript_19852/g.63075  ORF Transcript_19852/g.63075 Transcript_19852/m.63075 type:complete len:375 (+) Transcript_19852:570-1694(+)
MLMLRARARAMDSGIGDAATNERDNASSAPALPNPPAASSAVESPPPPPPPLAPAPTPNASSTHRAMPATVGPAKMRGRSSSTPKSSASRADSCVAASEWPPRSKKLSFRPTRERPKMSASTAATRSSVPDRGATNSVSATSLSDGAGSPRRSTLPLAVRGSAGISTQATGTMYSGRRSFRCARSPCTYSARAPRHASGPTTRDGSNAPSAPPPPPPEKVEPPHPLCPLRALSTELARRWRSSTPPPPLLLVAPPVPAAAGATYATSRFSPGRSSRAITTHSRTWRCACNTDSISPSSMRWPRILTCVSMRDRNSMSPVGSSRTKSPVRYSTRRPRRRAAGPRSKNAGSASSNARFSGAGSSRNTSAVFSGRFK